MSPDSREASLAEISRLLAESLDLNTVTQRITAAVRDLFGVRTAALLIVDASGGLIGVGGAGPLPPAPFRVRRESTLTALVVRDGVPLRTTDILDDPRVKPRPEDREVIEQAGHRAVMAVPLIGRDRVIGALSVGDRVGRVFTDDEVALAQAFAAQAAVALENARLYTEASTLLAVAGVVGSVSDVVEALRLTCREFSRLTGAETVSAHVVDRERRHLVPTAAYHVPKEALETLASVRIPLHEHGFTAGLYRAGEVLWSDDVPNDPRFASTLFRRFPHRSAILVPLVIDGTVKGGFYLVWWTIRHRPDEATLGLLKAIGRQVGPLLRHAELVTELGATAARLRTLAHTNQIVSSTLDMQAVLGEIARSAAALMGAPIVAFCTVDETARIVTVETFSDPGILEDFPLRQTPYGTDAIGWIAQERQPLAVDDLTDDKRVVTRAWWIARGYRSFYGLPILLEGELLGILTLSSREPLRLAPADHELLASFATQAALAIRNARLFQQAEIRRRMAEATKEHYRLLFERNLAGVIRTAVDGRMLECNEALARILGYASPAELVGRTMTDFYADPADRRALLERLARDRRITNHTLEIRRADGSRGWVMMNATMLGAGADATLEGIALDITDQKRAEQAEADVRELRSVASLANAAAHEINNPLAVIMGNLEMMKPRVADDPVLTNRVERALAAAQRISESVLAMGRVTRLEPVDTAPDLPQRLDLKASSRLTPPDES